MPCTQLSPDGHYWTVGYPFDLTKGVGVPFIPRRGCRRMRLLDSGIPVRSNQEPTAVFCGRQRLFQRWQSSSLSVTFGAGQAECEGARRQRRPVPRVGNHTRARGADKWRRVAHVLHHAQLAAARNIK
eukprot:6968742-Pyramimonas_sp.AAC.1